MMRLALEHCFADARVTAIIIDPLASNVRAHRFYAASASNPSGGAPSATTTASSTS